MLHPLLVVSFLFLSWCTYSEASMSRFITLYLITNNRKKAGKRHNTGHKGRSRVNRLAQGAPISEKSIENRMRVLISG